jgi:ferric-dicitrate binding protein FerR (iron transport regulator)
MNTPAKPDLELADLIACWHDGELTAEQRSRLVARLETEPSARRAFREATRFEALLHLEFPDSVVHFPTPVRAWYRKPPVWLAAAACLVLAAGLASLWNGPADVAPVVVEGPAGQSPQPEGSTLIASTPVARVTAMKDATSAPDAIQLAAGALLYPGTVQLESGTAELTFFSGARVTLQAPCKLLLKSDFRATLERGELTAEVPPHAIGFTIFTPGGQLRDLGTAFAIKVDGKGDADVHVLDGKVEAAPRGATSLVTLIASQATRIASGKLTPIRFEANGWPARPVTRQQAPLPASVHWSLDRFNGRQALDSNGIHPLWLKSTQRKNTPTSRLHPGIKGQALSFNGASEYAESSYRGVSGSNPRTVALWLRIPPDASYSHPNGIVAWGSPHQSRKWQVCWNNGDQGTVGAPRVEFGDGYVIGTTDLRDGLWHHLAAVYLGGTDSDVASHVKIYVDGRLETLSGRRSQFIRTDTESPQAIAVTLGRWLAYQPGKAPFCFRGSLDEIHIFEDALTPDQITHLATP